MVPSMGKNMPTGLCNSVLVRLITYAVESLQFWRSAKMQAVELQHLSSNSARSLTSYL